MNIWTMAPKNNHLKYLQKAAKINEWMHFRIGSQIPLLMVMRNALLDFIIYFYWANPYEIRTIPIRMWECILEKASHK